LFVALAKKTGAVEVSSEHEVALREAALPWWVIIKQIKNIRFDSYSKKAVLLL
jgi:hypothetical protein